MKDFIKEIERIQMLNKLIDNRRTGNPDEFSKRLGISRSQLYLLIDYLKDIGLQISFSRRFNTFYYEKDSRLLIDFTLKVLSHEEMENVSGGKSLINIPYIHFFGRNRSTLNHL